MIRSGIRRIFRLPPDDEARLDAMIDDEIRMHLELRVEQLVRAGVAPDDARAEALRRFGALDEARRELRRTADQERRSMRLRDSLDAALLDLRHAVRGLRREPGFAAVVVITLALGIGANAAMFGVVDRLLLAGPPHVIDSREVMRLYLGYPDSDFPERQSTLGYAQYETLRDGTSAFASLAAYTSYPREVTMERAGEKERVRVRYATATFFPLLGVRPAVGRFYREDEDVPGAGAPVVVLDHGAWLRLFGGDSSIIGRSVVLEGRPLAIIGLAPRAFAGVDLEAADFWIPMSSMLAPPASDWRTTRSVQWLQIVARLREGVSAERAMEEATAAERRAVEASGDAPDWARTLEMTPLPLWYDDAGAEGMETRIARWLFGVAAIVLLIACANVVNLLLARAVRRTREVAVRVALGAGRGRLVRLLLMEGMLLAVAGGTAGLLVASWGGALLRATLLENVSWGSSPVGARVLGFALVTTIVTGLLVALIPAVRASSPSLVGALKQGTRQAGGTRSPLRMGLTVAQAALSALLLVGAGLLVLSMWNVRGLRLGFDPDRVFVLQLSWPRLGELPADRRAAERARRDEFENTLLERLRGVPGVASTAMSAGTPFWVRMSMRVRAEGVDSVPQLPGGGPFFSVVSPGYFETVGTRILRGRPLGDGDRAGSELVALVNETAARTLWPGDEALGKCLFIRTDGNGCTRIVGITEDVHRLQIREEHAMHVYLPMEQHESESLVPLVRASGDPAALAPVLRRHIMALDPTLRWVNPVLLQDRVSPQMRPWRLGATVFAVFGGLALLVAAVGLYSVMSYATTQRTHEMGVRLALGAQAADVRRLILRAGVSLAGMGTALGIVAAVAAARWAEPLLFGTSARNPAVIGVVAVVLLAVALAASLIPARRAARIEPARALLAD